MKKDKLLIVLAKEPERGKVKTRLAKDIGAEKALKVYFALVRKNAEALKRLKTDTKIYFTPRCDILETLFPAKSEFKPQKGHDLGQRMANAFKENMSKYRKIILIGTDCPFITQRLIQKAFAALSRCEIVIGPAEDGGYYLIGLTKVFHKLFNNIRWSTNQVLPQTLKRCTLLKIKPILLKERCDIDTLSDYNKWRGNEKLKSK